jgi:Flp pilus assembly protein TadD
MVSLAVVYLRTNRDNSAKELLTSVIQIQPDNNIAYRYLGYCYLRLNAQATASYKSTLETDSNNLELLTSLKEDAAKAASEAIASYNKAIEISDKDWEAYRGLGVAYMLRALSNKDETLKAELREKAVQQWRLSLEIKSDQPNRERLLKLIRYYSE